MWVPSFPKKDFASAGWSGVIALVSLEALLTETSAASVLNADNDITVTIPQGTVVTEWISDTLVAAGFSQFAIQASPKTKNAPQMYVDDETLLQIINIELKRIE